MRDPFDTPAMRQFQAFKAQHPECVLFFRMGDFYEMFGDDAIALSKALGLTPPNAPPACPWPGSPTTNCPTTSSEPSTRAFVSQSSIKSRIQRTPRASLNGESRE